MNVSLYFLLPVEERYGYRITLFEKVKNDMTVGTIAIEVFMSNDNPTLYNVWFNAIGPTHKRLL